MEETQKFAERIQKGLFQRLFFGQMTIYCDYQWSTGVSPKLCRANFTITITETFFFGQNDKCLKVSNEYLRITKSVSS